MANVLPFAARCDIAAHLLEAFIAEYTAEPHDAPHPVLELDMARAMSTQKHIQVERIQQLAERCGMTPAQLLTEVLAPNVPAPIFGADPASGRLISSGILTVGSGSRGQDEARERSVLARGLLALENEVGLSN